MRICFRGLLLSLAAGFSWMMPAIAQTVTPTIGAGNVGTTVTDTGSYTITDGTQRLDTLFHSFEDFSPGNTNVDFDVSTNPTVNLVIARITGNTLSFIDGQLSLTGGNSPDLFLVNPNGIAFGPNATLDLPSSFIPTTATSVLFNEGFEFSAVAPSEAPLLTVSTPTGLQFNAGVPDTTVASKIEVVNTGHALIQPGGSGLIIDTGPNVGLRIGANKTLALLGPDIDLTGGILSNTFGGHLHLGSPQSGTVELTPSDTGWQFDYANINKLGTIHLGERALVDASSTAVGQLTIDAQALNVENGSMLLARNYGSQLAPALKIRATGDITITGMGNSNGVAVASNINTGAFSTGRGGDINISANNVSAQGGGRIFSTSSGQGQGGNVDAQVNETVSISGVGGTRSFSLIGASTAGSENAGNVTINSSRLLISDGAVLLTTTLSSGDSGSLNLNISDSIDVEGFSLLTGQSSAISALTLGSGNAGDVTVNTQQLTLRNAGGLDSSTFASGNAGSITANVTQEIRIEESPKAPIPLRLGIASSADFPSETFQTLFGLPALPTGSAGDVSVSTPTLIVTDGGEVAVKSRGTGDGGTLTIEANQVLLDQGGKLSALTKVGNGGDIVLNLGELLLMRDNSLIDTESRGIGNGGNLTLNSPVIIGLENSDIVASAITGNGGNIDITTQSLLGFTFREELTLENDINASSQFGVSGTVDINNFTFDPGASLVKLPEAPADIDNQVVAACSSNGDNQFIASGRGGMPVSPNSRISGGRLWYDVRTLPDFPSNERSLLRSEVEALELKGEANNNLIREASNWETNHRGQIEFLTETSTADITDYPTACLLQTNAE